MSSRGLHIYFKGVLIFRQKWKRIAIYFMVGLPKTQGMYDSTWIIVDKSIKLAQLIPIKVDYISKQFVKICVKEVVRLHRVSHVCFPSFHTKVCNLPLSSRASYMKHQARISCLAQLFILNQMISWRGQYRSRGTC